MLLSENKYDDDDDTYLLTYLEWFHVFCYFFS